MIIILIIKQNEQILQIQYRKVQYVYRSYSEVLALVTISMFRDLLQVQTNNSKIIFDQISVISHCKIYHLSLNVSSFDLSHLIKWLDLY